MQLEMMKQQKIKLQNVPENSNKRTTTVTFGLETDNVELYRRAAYDTGTDSLATVLRECIDIGFPIFCEKHGITPTMPKKRELSPEEELNRRLLLEKRLRNLKHYKPKKEGEGEK
jgi:hypothetical protein